MSIRIVELPGLDEHGDVFDWLASHNIDDLRATCSLAPRTWNAAELLERKLPEPRWAIPGVIAEGLTVLAGRPKFGKSWVAMQLALAVNYGGRALSQVQVEQGEALYLALEDNERRLQARLQRLVHDGPGPSLLNLQAFWPRLDEGGTEALEMWLDEHPRTRLVVIDTWTLIRPRPHKGADQYFEDTNAARRLKRLADERHIAIVALHHTRKPFMGGSVSDFLDEVLGSSGLTAAADSVLVLQRKRGERDGVLHLTGRDILEESRSLEWDDETGWSLGGSAEEASLNRERQRVLKILREADEPSTIREVAMQLGKTADATKKILWRMSRDALVMTDGRGHYSAPIPADAGYLSRAEVAEPDEESSPARAAMRARAQNCAQAGARARAPELEALEAPGHRRDQNEVFSGSSKDCLRNRRSAEAASSEDVPVPLVPQVPQVPPVPPVPQVVAFPNSRATTSCGACGRELGRFEQHWPWLHNHCRLPPSPQGASP